MQWNKPCWNICIMYYVLWQKKQQPRKWKYKCDVISCCDVTPGTSFYPQHWAALPLVMPMQSSLLFPTVVHWMPLGLLASSVSLRCSPHLLPKLLASALVGRAKAPTSIKTSPKNNGCQIALPVGSKPLVPWKNTKGKLSFSFPSTTNNTIYNCQGCCYIDNKHWRIPCKCWNILTAAGTAGSQQEAVQVLNLKFLAYAQKNHHGWKMTREGIWVQAGVQDLSRNVSCLLILFWECKCGYI